MPTKPDTLPEPSGQAADDLLVDVRDLHVHFALRGSSLARVLGRPSGYVRAVDGVSFGLRKGEVLGLVGESGSGKTTLGRALLGLVRASSGSIRYRGQELTGLSESRMRPMRRQLQMVFQDPHASLNPAMDLEHAVGHPIHIHGLATDAHDLHAKVVASLERVGLVPVERFLSKYPGDLSGGQKQRAVLARAVILGPEMLVADEPVSMLDMSVRAKILELMLDLRRDLDLTYVYITHDLATAKFFCDRVAIMYLGRIVEIGPTEEIFADPKHPYTQSLLRAVPEPDPAKSVPRELPRGEVPDAAERPLGCSFHPRCPRAFEVCGWESRDLRALLEQRWTRLGEEAYEAESALFADIGEFDAGGWRAVVSPAHGHSADEIATLLAEMRAADPDEPFWRGVQEIRQEGGRSDGRVVVEFRDGIDPGLTDLGAVSVACHLHDETVLSRAQQYRSSGPAR